MIVIPMPMYPLYVKKEDVRDVVMWQRRAGALVLVAAALVIGIMQFLVSPKLLELYASLNTMPPAIVQSSFNIMLVIASVSVVSALYLLFSLPDYTKVDVVAKKYKDGEMIKTKELVDGRFLWIILGALAVMVTYLIITTILPIYNLTNQY